MAGTAELAGLALAAAGAAWAGWAAFEMLRAPTPLVARGRPLVLVEEGPFRFGRNPMALGLATLLVGASLALHSVLPALAAVAFVALMQRVQIPREEARLAGTFGGWYSDYTARVRRWL